MSFRSRPSFLKTKYKVWCLLVDKDSSELKYGDPFPVVTSDIDIHGLKGKIREERPIDLAHIDSARLEVWEYLSDSDFFFNPDPDKLRPLLDFSNKNITRHVRPDQKVSALIRTDSAMENDVTKLLVRVLPGVLHANGRYFFSFISFYTG